MLPDKSCTDRARSDARRGWNKLIEMQAKEIELARTDWPSSLIIDPSLWKTCRFNSSDAWTAYTTFLISLLHFLLFVISTFFLLPLFFLHLTKRIFFNGIEQIINEFVQDRFLSRKILLWLITHCYCLWRIKNKFYCWRAILDALFGYILSIVKI